MAQQQERPSRLVRLMRLYNQCLEDKLEHKVRQAEYLILQMKLRNINDELAELEIERAKALIKYLKLNQIR